MTPEDIKKVKEAFDHADDLIYGEYYPTPRYMEWEELLNAAISILDKAAPSGWQDISTAPRDEVGVLLYLAVGDDNHITYVGHFKDGHWWVTNFSDEELYYYEPTHWMPLPKPPEVK